MGSGDRFVVLGVARPRAEWFHTVSRWATTAAIPAEFVKCISAEELGARLASGRSYSAVLLDGATAGVDRDLIARVQEAGCAPIVVDDGARASQWLALGAAAVVPPAVEQSALLDVLASHATMLARGEQTDVALEEPLARVPWAGRLAVVCGAGGTGASVLAAALAQGLVGSGRWGDGVLLADLALRAEQAMLNDIGDVAPGVQDLVDAHRIRSLPLDEVRALTYSVPARGYRLLLGLRRPQHWSGVRPRAFDAALESLRRSFAVTVADVTADFEGEAQGGSADVEDRNFMARTAALSADAVFVVGRTGTKGLHSLIRVLGDLSALGVPAARVQPVVNGAPRSPRARATVARAVGELTASIADGGWSAPVFVPHRRVDDAIRDGAPLPAPLPQLLAGAFEATLARADRGDVQSGSPAGPEPIEPGSLGSWAEEAG